MRQTRIVQPDGFVLTSLYLRTDSYDGPGYVLNPGSVNPNAPAVGCCHRESAELVLNLISGRGCWCCAFYHIYAERKKRICASFLEGLP